MDHDLTWRYRWPAGRRLEADLPAVVACAGQTVCDLGCGQGALARAALAQGAAHVTAADGAADAVALLRASINDPRFTAVQHSWGEPIPGGPFTVILGGDILYRPALHPELIRSIALSLAPDGLALLVDPRRTLEAELPLLAATHHLTWHPERRDDYTLVRLTRIASP